MIVPALVKSPVAVIVIFPDFAEISLDWAFSKLADVMFISPFSEMRLPSFLKLPVASISTSEAVILLEFVKFST